MQPEEQDEPVLLVKQDIQAIVDIQEPVDKQVILVLQDIQDIVDIQALQAILV